MKKTNDLMIDKNICGLQPLEKFQGLYTLEIYNELYQDFLFQQYFTEILNETDSLLENQEYIQTLSKQRSPAARGIAMEDYILDKLVYMAMVPVIEFHWKFFPYKADGKLEKEITLKDRKNNVDEKNICRIVREYLSSGLKGKISSVPKSSETKKNVCEFSGKLFVPSTRYLKHIDALFVDIERLTIFLLQITSNINSHSKSDALFNELGSSQSSKEDINNEKSELRQLAQWLRLYQDVIYVQWIWVGLVDGEIKSQGVKNLIKGHIQEDSWIHVVNDKDSVFKNIKVLFSDEI